jgi:dolichyl-diphosphooligosaccharide--protein glycosyltransferase
MKNSLMYKMSYYRFAELFGGQQAADRVRNQRIPNAAIQLDTLDEAFTSENWIVRIYQVKKEDPLGRELKAANAFEAGKKLKKSVSAASSAGASGAKGVKAGGRKGRPST